MGYLKAEDVLPDEVIELIQKYVDGKNIYIPRKENSRKSWGSETQTKKELFQRNQSLYEAYKEGAKTFELATKYYLSEKSVQRIIREMKKIHFPKMG